MVEMMMAMNDEGNYCDWISSSFFFLPRKKTPILSQRQSSKRHQFEEPQAETSVSVIGLLVSLE